MQANIRAESNKTNSNEVKRKEIETQVGCGRALGPLELGPRHVDIGTFAICVVLRILGRVPFVHALIVCGLGLCLPLSNSHNAACGLLMTVDWTVFTGVSQC